MQFHDERRTPMTKKNPALLPTLSAMCGNAIFGFSFMFSRIALEHATP